MRDFLFTSESVGIGHPDKVCDQISDAILDACLSGDPGARVACETLTAPGLIILAGEISTSAQIDYGRIVREQIRQIGYIGAETGFDYRTCGILTTINRQSTDIALGLDSNGGAGDQGIVFGYACDETDQLMPLPIALSHEIVRKLHRLRVEGGFPFLGPDAKTQVTVQYNEEAVPIRIDAVVLSTQHSAEMHQEALVEEMKHFLAETLPEELIDRETKYYINPTGRFVIGGPNADCGLTGRKTSVDTYGGMARHGGGAFSGKDPTKIDRSGSYGARYVAKNIVAAGLAQICEVQISYAIGKDEPVSIRIDTRGTGKVPDHELSRTVHKVFDLTPHGLITTLDLRKPIYVNTAFGGHFGRDEIGFSWEKTNKIDDLHRSI